MNCELTGLAFQDVLLLMGMKSGTGELILESGNNIGTIIFHKGTILQAFSPYSRAIGDLLVEEGIITEGELLEILLYQKKSGISPIGNLFLKTGKVTFEIIEAMVHQQIRQSIKEFTTWRKIRAGFTEKEIKPFDKISVHVNEFISSEVLHSARIFLSVNTEIREDKAVTTAAAAVV